MDTIDDLYSNIKLGILERVNSPLTFALLAAWSIINFEVFVIIFTEGTADYKLHLIATNVFPSWKEAVIHGAILPIISAIIYVFIYPYLSAYALKESIKSQNKFKEIKDGKLLSEKESKVILRKIDDIKAEYEEKLSNKDNTIDRLRKQVDDLREEYTPDKNPPTSNKHEPEVLDASVDLDDNETEHDIESSNGKTLTENEQYKLIIKENIDDSVKDLGQVAYKILMYLYKRNEYISLSDLMDALTIERNRLLLELNNLKEEKLIDSKVGGRLTFYSINKDVKKHFDSIENISSQT